jgi:hypothetical protein
MITNIETVDLRNIGIIKGRVSDDIINVLKEEIEEIRSDWSKGTPWNHELAGHIRKEFLLTKSNSVIEPLVVAMAMEHNQKYNYVDPNFDVEKDKKYRFALESLWVNFQERHEFNPVHRHAGMYSFVIWIEIPYFLNFERPVGPGKNANVNRAGMFEFIYTDILGHISGEAIAADRTYQGDICMFPAGLHHMVHPFYSTDKMRISVAGNLKVVTE